MRTWRRTVRTTPRVGLNAADVLTAALTSELLEPSPHLWLVSPWISDIVVLDNTEGHLDVVLDHGHAGSITLSEVLAQLTRMGTQLHVAVRPDDHNLAFLGRLERALGGRLLDIHHHEDLHEKTLCGNDWLVSGSMNFTWRGLELNEEAITYSIDPQLAAQTRLEFEHRWVGCA